MTDKLFVSPPKLTARQAARAEFLDKVEHVVLDPVTDYGLTVRQIAFLLLCRYGERVSADRVRRAIHALTAERRLYVARSWVCSQKPPASFPVHKRFVMRGYWALKAYPPHEGEKEWRQPHSEAA